MFNWKPFANHPLLSLFPTSYQCPKSTANRRWFPDLPDFKKENKHKALDDITESLNELKYYREHLFKQ